MATLDAEKRKQARAAARKAREMAAKLEAAAGIVSDSERKRQASITSRTIWIEPTPQSILDERERLEKDDRAWLRFFFPDPPFGFWYDFTSQQGAMIQAIGDAILHGGDQAIAASRGEGKTVIARRLTLKYALSGRIKFAVLFNATGSDATDSLKAIRGDLEENERLANYYREVCTPVERLEGVPQRAATMLVSGKELYSGREFANYPAKFVWCGHEIYLPHVPGSPAGGAIIATRGLDSSVRGLNKRGRRPDVAIIDDPDTEETARSEEQARKLEDRIDRAIAGLGGQQRGIARVLLTTLQNRTCVSFRFTDPMSKSSWKGKRFRFLLQPPSRDDLWEEYVGMVQSNLQMQDADGEPLDPFARGAHAFYLQNREAMEAGAVVANPHRYDHADLGDGTHLEESALQRYYNLVAKIGPEAVATEYDNDPPEDSGPIESGLSATRIQRQVSGYARHVLPPGCDLLTQGIDVRKSALHWVVRAWRKEPWAGYTVAYGVQDVVGTVAGSDEGVDVALRRAIHARWVEFREQEWLDQDGNVIQPPDNLTLIDAGWKTDTIYQVCQELGAGIMPSMGFGRSNGCVATSFRPVAIEPQGQVVAGVLRRGPLEIL